jgi:surface protein
MTEPPSVGSWNTGAVTNMSGVFSGCSKMTVPPAVGNWSTGKVTSMYRMFAGCSTMTEPPAVGSWDTSAVTSMGSMFYGCSTMTVPPAVGSWNTSAVTNMSSMFERCSAITEPPAVDNWNTSKVTNMSGMFDYCTKMTSLDVSSWDFSKVTSWFNRLGLQACSALRELKVPAGAKIMGLSEHRAQGEYASTWGNAERGITGSTASNLVSTVNAGNGAGTWTWDLAGYTVNFMITGSGMAMPPEQVKTDEAWTVPNCEVTRPYYDFVEWRGSDGKTYHAGDIIPAGTFTYGYKLTLTAVFEAHEYGPGELDGNMQITVPTSINYVVDVDGSLMGPTNAYIQNLSAFAAHVSSVDVDAEDGFEFVEDAAASSAANSVDMQIGPEADMLQVSEYLSKKDVSDMTKWNMKAAGAAESADKLSLKTAGNVSHVTKDITSQTKFGIIKWYVMPGESVSTVHVVGNSSGHMVNDQFVIDNGIFYDLDVLTPPSGLVNHGYDDAASDPSLTMSCYTRDGGYYSAKFSNDQTFTWEKVRDVLLVPNGLSWHDLEGGYISIAPSQVEIIIPPIDVIFI